MLMYDCDYTNIIFMLMPFGTIKWIFQEICLEVVLLASSLAMGA